MSGIRCTISPLLDFHCSSSPNKGMDEVFIDEEFLAGQLEGSYEHHLEVVGEALLQVEGFEGFEVFGTFPTYAVLGHPDGTFVQANYAIEDGQVVLGESEAIDVPTMSRLDMVMIARGTTADIVDSLIHGDSKSALKMAEELLNLVRAGVPVTAEAVNEELVRVGSDFLQWRENLREVRDDIIAEVGAPEVVEAFKSMGDAIKESNEVMTNVVAGLPSGDDGELIRIFCRDAMASANFLQSLVSVAESYGMGKESLGPIRPVVEDIILGGRLASAAARDMEQRQ